MVRAQGGRVSTLDNMGVFFHTSTNYHLNRKHEYKEFPSQIIKL